MAPLGGSLQPSQSYASVKIRIKPPEATDKHNEKSANIILNQNYVDNLSIFPSEQLFIFPPIARPHALGCGQCASELST